MLLRSCALLLATTVLHAEVVEFQLNAGKSRSVTLPSNADDSNFTEPRGYVAHGARAKSFIQKVEFTNDGEKPIVGHLLTINERDYTDIDGLGRTLGLSAEPGRQAFTMERLFSFWRDHRSHAGCGLPLAYEPFAMLNFWGYTLCGEDTQSLARLAYAFEIPARHVQLNGHVVGEYRYDGGWHMVDGDQNAIYLKLDNKTIASADDIRMDPFLALRTKVFGRHSPQELSASAFNTSLIEHVSPEEPKAVKIKTGPAPLNTFTVNPGESIVWHFDTAPETTIGKINSEKPDAVKTGALATIEHRAMAKNYKLGEGGTVTVASPFPIWKAVNQTTGVTIPIKSGDVPFRVAIPVKSEADQLTIFSQCSRLALPVFSRGDNVVKFDGKDGKARVAVHFQPEKKLVLPTVKLSTKTPAFAGPPKFAVGAPPRADRIWWQVSALRDFSFVPPSLEGVMPTAPDLRFDPLTTTFLNPGTSYFIRAKIRQDGIWGEWCEPVGFRVSKPAAPADATFEGAGGDFVRLAWNSNAKNAEYLIFGSNRRDFVPQIFSDTEIVAMDHSKVTEQRENKNLVATTKQFEHEFVPKHRFYRIIARNGEALSVPGPLLVLPPELAKGLPPATILQTRATKDGDRDVYKVKEEKLP